MNELGRPKRDAKIVNEYAKGIKTMGDLGEKYGLTKARISQIIKRSES